MESRINIVKEYLKNNSKLQLINEEYDHVDIHGCDIENVVTKYNLPKDMFVFSVNVSEKSFIKIQVYMKKVQNYQSIGDKICAFFNMDNMIEFDDSVIVFSKKYVIKEEDLENYIVNKLNVFFESEVGIYSDLTKLMESMLLINDLMSNSKK